MDFYQIKLKLNSIESILTSSVILNKILKIIKNPNLSAKELASNIKQDQALASKILKLSNSAFYGFARSITTIRDAISLLGYNTIKSVVLSYSYQQIFDNIDFDKDYLQIISRHSMLTAFLAEKIYEKEGSKIEEDSEIVFLGGLFHDIGKIALIQSFPEYYYKVFESVDENYSYIDAEKDIFDFTHQKVGAFLLEKWDLPDIYVKVAKKHHYTAKNELNSSEDIIAVANKIANHIEYQNEGKYSTEEFSILELDVLHEIEDQIPDIIKFISEMWGLI